MPVNEVGFDVLRDRLVTDLDDVIVPEPDVAVVDEADSVLVDSARVPLVLAGDVDAGVVDAEIVATVRRLRADVHYETDRRGRTVHLTALGLARVERRLGGIDLYTEDRRTPSRRSTSRCTRTRCCTATSTTSCATARSS